MVTVQAGHDWDDFVADCVTQQWSGVEALSGIPGTVGASPIQNVGAYGQDVSQTIANVRTYDRVLQQIRTFYFADCNFGYRDSVFKHNPGRYVILDVSFQLRLDHHSQPIAYAELASKLGVETGKRSYSDKVREAVLELRAAKGMVLNPVDHDTWSVGSFFTNPIVSAHDHAKVPVEAPHWVQPDGSYKLSAAWLIENSGHPKGFGLNNRAQLSSKHSLALTNRGDATAGDIMELAHSIQHDVHERFGINLAIEPNLVGEF
jgi:UDP-N-acetylmuramate dehydrogenase